MKTVERSYVGPRQVGPVAMDAADVQDFRALDDIGIGFPVKQVSQMVAAMDDQQGGVTTGSVTTPIQFLQVWLPGFVRVATAARQIDDFVGVTTAGSWEDEEVVQGVLENTGSAVPYGDYQNVSFSSFNSNFERRTIIRFEKGLKVSQLEAARTAKIRIDAAAEKRLGASEALEIQRNNVGFVGYNSGANRTYGFLNDPALPAYSNLAAGAASSTQWAQKTMLEIAADIRTMFAALATQAKGRIKTDSKLTLAVGTSIEVYLTSITQYGVSVIEHLNKTYPNLRVVSAPQLDGANGGANAVYLYAEEVEDGSSDNRRTWDQIVPAKFQAQGVEKQVKAYVENYVNATAGVILKRPYAVVRRSGA